MSPSSTSRKPNRQYSAEDKANFFRRLDRGGTIRAVAAELGLNVDACYRWRHETGQSTARGKDRTYSAEDKSEFFRLLALHGNVSAVAKILGFVRVTCYKWAHQAGKFTGRKVEAQRTEFLQLRADGVSRAAAAQQLKVDKRTAQDWDKGIRQFSGGRVHADGTVVRYNSRVKQSLVKNPRHSYAREVPLDPGALERVVDPWFLSLQDREFIHDLYSRGTSMRSIAVTLARSPSTISRELRRNQQHTVGYLPYAAHRATVLRRTRPKLRKLQPTSELRRYVSGKLMRKWSPEQITNRLVKDFPTDPEMRVSHETIYQALYIQGRGALKREVAAALRRGHTRRKPQRSTEHRTSRFTTPMINISERPAEAEDRAVPGHWEGDLITGSLNQSAIGTLVERSSRYIMLVHLQHDHTAESVRDGLVKTISTLPAHLRGSLTWDQGAEMAEHGAFRIATGMDVFFCDPASPWQRGSNENSNGLLRQYFPKGTDLSVYAPEDLESVAQQLNSRPRKTLGWDTPAERIGDLLVTP